MSDLEKCIEVHLQLNLEVPNSHSIEKESLHHLCAAFNFYYKTFSPDEWTFFADIYFPADHTLYHNDYINIVKTFALTREYQILYSKLIELPYYSDLICLDGVDMGN